MNEILRSINGGNMLKNILGIIAFCLLFSFAQAETLKIAYLDSDRIMQESKDTKEAQTTFENARQSWMKTAEEKKAELEKLKENYEQKKLILSESGKKEAEQVISTKQKELEDYIQDIFGDTGLAAQKNTELMEPISKKFKDAVKKVADDNKYDLVLDTSSLIYGVPALDITDQIIQEMNSTQSIQQQQQPTTPQQQQQDQNRNNDPGSGSGSGSGGSGTSGTSGGKTK